MNSEFIEIKYCAIYSNNHYEINYWNIDHDVLENASNNDKSMFITKSSIKRISQLDKVKMDGSNRKIQYFYIILSDGTMVFIINKDGEYGRIAQELNLLKKDNRLNKKALKK